MCDTKPEPFCSVMPPNCFLLKVFDFEAFIVRKESINYQTSMSLSYLGFPRLEITELMKFVFWALWVSKWNKYFWIMMFVFGVFNGLQLYLFIPRFHIIDHFWQKNTVRAWNLNLLFELLNICAQFWPKPKSNALLSSLSHIQCFQYLKYSPLCSHI